MSMRMPATRAVQFGLGLLLGALALQAGAAESERPNIVLLLADDWGFSDVGAYGGEMATPNLDMLAARGMRFSNFHVSASCAPTRSMLMTYVGVIAFLVFNLVTGTLTADLDTRWIT